MCVNCEDQLMPVGVYIMDIFDIHREHDPAMQMQFSSCEKPRTTFVSSKTDKLAWPQCRSIGLGIYLVLF